MKKKRVSIVALHSYEVEPSEYGANRIEHPCIIEYKRIPLDDLTKGIQVGDIVRVDGLPFKRRPRNIYMVEGVKKKLKVPLYVATQIDSGLWVLRKVDKVA